MVAAVKDKQIVTARRIAEAKAEAQRLAQLAYGPQPVKQPDETTLALCWAGRLHRALELANAAQQAGDATRLAAVERAIATLTVALHEADDAAQQAASDYAALCVVADRAPEELPVVTCSCVGCRAAARFHNLVNAAGGVRDAVWRLLGAAEGEVPPLLTLVQQADDAAARERLWRQLKSIADAMTTYAATCAEYEAAPQWREVWR
jgi:hypothetical protein